MKLLVLLSSLVIVQARTIKEECDGEVINGIYHNKEVLLAHDVDRPYLLDVDRHNNILYFSYSIDNHATCKTGQLNLYTKVLKDIDGVRNGFSQTVDQASQTVYIGGGYKIYKYNYKLDKLDVLVDNRKKIWNVYFRGDLYFATEPDEKFYIYKEGEWKKFADLEDTTALNFVIDRENVMFYSNNTGLYSQLKGTKHVVVYKTCPLYTIRQLTTDIHGKVYACLQDGIYAVNKDKVSLDKVLDVYDGFGVTFDGNNNIIYSDSKRLYRMTPNEHSSCHAQLFAQGPGVYPISSKVRIIL